MSDTPPRRGTAVLKIRVTPGRTAIVTVADGSKVVRRTVLRQGAATVTLKKLTKGRHRFTVRHPAQPGVTASSNRVQVRVR